MLISFSSLSGWQGQSLVERSWHMSNFQPTNPTWLWQIWGLDLPSMRPILSASLHPVSRPALWSEEGPNQLWFLINNTDTFKQNRAGQATASLPSQMTHLRWLMSSCGTANFRLIFWVSQIHFPSITLDCTAQEIISRPETTSPLPTSASMNNQQMFKK